jgi:hypothetical protein
MKSDKNHRVRGTIPQILQKNGIKKGSGFWRDYEKAKDLICINLSADQYESVIQEITEYLKV